MKLSDNGENKKSSANAGNLHASELPNEETGLAPCPFCGSSTKFHKRKSESDPNDTLWWVVCSKHECGVGFNIGSWTQSEAIQRWNRREPPTSSCGSSQGVRVEAESQSLPSDVGVQGQAARRLTMI